MHGTGSKKLGVNEDRICKVSCKEGKNGNEDKKVCCLKLSCVLDYGFRYLWNGKYGISLPAGGHENTVKCMCMGPDHCSYSRV